MTPKEASKEFFLSNLLFCLFATATITALRFPTVPPETFIILFLGSFIISAILLSLLHFTIAKVSK